jgi:hypothetical protein
VLLVVVSLIVPYPEEQVGNCVIYTDPLPEMISISEDGFLQDIFVHDGDIIGKNYIVGIIRNSASYQRIKVLDSMVNSWSDNIEKSEFSKILIPASFAGIGELQGVFKNAYWNFAQFKVYVDDPFFKDLKLGPSAVTGVAGVYKLDGFRSGAAFQEYRKTIYGVLINFIQAVEELKTEIKEWKNKYIISAPKDGKVYFPSVVFRNMELKEGKPFLYVLPLAKTYYAQVILGQAAYQMIKVGQKVNISLPGFSNNLLEGSVAKVSPIIDADGKFAVKVQLNRDLLYKIDTNIDLRNELHGSASIIIAQKSLLRKIISKSNF